MIYIFSHSLIHMAQYIEGDPLQTLRVMVEKFVIGVKSPPMSSKRVKTWRTMLSSIHLCISKQGNVHNVE